MKKNPTHVEPSAPEPSKKPRYTLEGLLAQCNPEAPIAPEEREWVDAKPAGLEM